MMGAAMEAITVNGTAIPPQAIAAEMQYHPAKNREAAWHEAATALVIRRLLLDEADRLDVAAESDGEGDTDERRIAALLAQEIATPTADEATLRRYWAANPALFATPEIYEAAHILFAAAPADEAARAAANRQASETIAALLAEPKRFAELARERSACPSGASGGLLGQQSRGDLVPELETFVMALEDGQICPTPIATRYGYHVLRLDRLVRGATLPFEAAAPLVEQHLAARSWQRAVSQYLRLLIGGAQIEGLALDGAATPLVQ